MQSSSRLSKAESSKKIMLFVSILACIVLAVNL